MTRLPKLAERFLAGDLDVRVFTTIDFRTALVSDSELVARLDSMLAEQAPHWNALSRAKLTGVIDWLVVNLDHHAQRIARDRDDDRRIDIRPDLNQPGMADVYGRPSAVDGTILDRRLELMAGTVCLDDLRTKAQRRADALIALAEDATTLACRCGQAQCPAANGDGSTTAIVVHVIAEDGNMPGYVPGYGPIPADTVRDIVDKPSAKTKPLIMPKDPAPEPGYRPSAGLAEFIRLRDLSCRWPGCDVPAERCDVDHTIPYPHGPTHPSNLKLYCRPHHLLKTFFSGPGGWTETQDANGTMTFRSPAGRTYATTPGGSLFFPKLANSTGRVKVAGEAPPNGNPKTVKMPTRKRTRAAERAAQIHWERGRREAQTLANPPPF